MNTVDQNQAIVNFVDDQAIENLKKLTAKVTDLEAETNMKLKSDLEIMGWLAKYAEMVS